jgi:hypothetical protein
MPTPSTQRRSPSHREHGAAPLLPPRIGVAIRCQFCPGQQFRRSRLRTDDIRDLLLMRYPVRCLRCGQRQLVSFTVAALSLSSSTRQPRPKRTPSEERGWTEPAERMVLKSSEKAPPPEK